MWKDELVEETRKIRDAYAARFNYDLKAIVRDFQEQQRRGGRRIIRLAPKEPSLQPETKAS